MTAPSRVRPAEAGHSAFTRRTLVKGAAWATPVAAFSLSAPAMAASSPCVDLTYNSTSTGRLLSGSLLGTDLDNVVAVQGVTALATEPAAEGSTGGSEYDQRANPLNAGVLNAIDLELGGVAGLVSFLAAILTDQNVGTLNQFAFAHELAGDAEVAEVGASGAVADNGVINLDQGAGAPPALGSLDLKSVLEQLTGNEDVATLVASVADLQLEVGAVAGRATSDRVCDPAEPTTRMAAPEEVITREHLLASLRLIVESDTVGGVLTALEETVEAVPISTEAIISLLSALLGPLGPVADALLGLITGVTGLDVEIGLDLSQVTDPLPADPGSAIHAELGAGRLTVDVASLLGGAYPGGPSEWLNSLAANSRLFIDYPVPGDAVSNFLHDLTSELIAKVKELVTIRISAGSVTGIGATGLLIEGSLADFLEGRGTVRLVALGIDLVGRLAQAAVSGLLVSIGELVDGAIDGLLNQDGLVPGLLDGVNSLLASLFTVLEDVLQLTVNAQNAPENGSNPPTYYQDPINVEAGQYDVAALHLQAVGALNVLDLSIARGSVGPNALRA